MKHVVLPIILLLALLIALPGGEAQTQSGNNTQQERSWNRRVPGAGDYQTVLEVSGRVEVSRFFKMPDPLDLRSICEAKREAERRAILSSGLSARSSRISWEALTASRPITTTTDGSTSS